MQQVHRLSGARNVEATISNGGESMKEHKTIIRHSCGCKREIVTFGYKIPKRQVSVMRESECPRCQLTYLLLQLDVKLNPTPNKNPRPLIDEYDESW